MDGRSMSEIHRIFGLDWSLRSFSASPWPLDQSRVNIFMFFPQFIHRSGVLDRGYRLFSDFSFDLATEVLASRFDIWPEKIFKEIWAAFWRRECETFDKWSLDIPIRPLVWKIRLLVRFLSKLPPRPICTHWSLNTLLTWGRAENEKMRVIFSCWNLFFSETGLFFWIYIFKSFLLVFL